MTYWWLVPAVAVSSMLMTGLLRHYALRKSILDIPNDRSSHTVPTPRGGGMAILAGFLLSLPVLIHGGHMEWPFALAMIGASIIVGVVGFVDDHGGVPARYRLLVHFVAAGWVMFWLGALPPLIIFGIEMDLGRLGYVVTALYLVWLLNLYNFMDGIDGLAGVEAMSACLAGALLFLLHGYWSHALLAVVLAAAVSGFLFWNFPPARIFMGDAGSGFLGIALGVMSLQAGWLVQPMLWAWVIMLGVFVVDATVTLLVRLYRGENLSEGHRTHAYQVASRRWGGHRPVTLAVLAINLLWLLPIALVVGLGYVSGAIGVIVAYVPLVVVALRLGAGQPERAAG